MTKTPPPPHTSIPPARSFVRGKVSSIFERTSKSIMSTTSNFLFSKSTYTPDRKWKLVAKMVAITAPPLIALAILSVIMGYQFVEEIGASSSARSFYRTSSQLAAFLIILQGERDQTCAFLDESAIGNQTDAFDKLLSARNATDESLLSLTAWPVDEDFNSVFPDPNSFYQFLSMKRANFTAPSATCFAVIQFYSANMHFIGSETKNLMYDSDEGQYWRFVDALDSVTSAEDLAGVKRSIGKKFFQNGFLDIATYHSFSDAAGSMGRFLDQAMTSASYSNVADNAQIQSTISSINKMQNDLYINFTTDPIGDQLSQYWFDNMTVFIDHNIGNLRKYIETQISISSNARQSAKDWQFGTAMLAVLIAVLLCAPTACWIGFKNYKMNMEINQKMFELNNEKQKTDLLLHEMLPHLVIVELKAGRRINPQIYASATIFFSDIMGFTALSAKSHPTEIVTLLNALYTTMDNILDRYSCYKVETIGDAYMVASGVPKTNENEHSSEICTMALDVLREVTEIRIPHMPDEHLLMRVGVHTGPVAAGIVGLKMPRYCLFGDTVNTASRMESTGQPMCIHLSQTTSEHLQMHHSQKHFIFQKLENSLQIKGKGSMDTYWLLGKNDFPYKINLDRARCLVEEGQYWRF